MQITQQRSALVDSILPGQGLLRDAALVVGFTFIVIMFAQIAVKLPFTPVPITGGTLGVLLTGGALGANRGAASLVLYMLIGMVGIPVFAPTSGALEGQLVHVILPWLGEGDLIWDRASGGYIVGYIGAAWVVGRLAEQGWDRSWRVLLALLAGNVVLYLPGLAWLWFWAANLASEATREAWMATGSPLGATLQWGLWPFVVGDLTKLYVASVALPGAWALFGRKER
ncbi:MAG: biotin transporter BioY [Chloroflexi bacterium]|nr:biotin transporter BioY [Chloroflexota bacterium]